MDDKIDDMTDDEIFETFLDVQIENLELLEAQTILESALDKMNEIEEEDTETLDENDK